jgi:nucleoside-diphosphate-sugar epimerase
MRTLSGGLRFYTPGGDAFVDVRDVSEIILRLLENDISGERFLVTGHNSSFRELFERICRQLDVRTPSVAAGSFMTSFAWRIAGMLGRITGKRPTLTRESAASAHRTTRYSSEKVLKQFPDFQFRSLDEMIGNTINGRLHEHVFRSKQ